MSFVVAEFMAFQRTNAKAQKKTKHKNELLRDIVCLFGSFFSRNEFLTIFLSRSEILKKQNKMAYNFKCSHLSDHQTMLSRKKVTTVSKVAKKLPHPVVFEL
jgi:hypothetical protein